MFARDDFADRRKLILPVTFAGGPDRIGDFVKRRKRILLVAFRRRT